MDLRPHFLKRTFLNNEFNIESFISNQGLRFRFGSIKNMTVHPDPLLHKKSLGNLSRKFRLERIQKPIHNFFTFDHIDVSKSVV